MIKVSDSVKNILLSDDVALESVRMDFMNYSKYARIIQKEVEEETMKLVDEKTIVITLSRIAYEIQKQEKNREKVKLLNLSVHSNLVDLSYNKTPDVMGEINRIYSKIPNSIESFFTITQGISEVNIIGDCLIVEECKNELIHIKPLFYMKDLAGITGKFSVNYLNIPNVLHEIGKYLAIKNINIIEVVSTTSEINYIIEKKDLEIAVAQLTKLL
jgi:aspartokinase